MPAPLEILEHLIELELLCLDTYDRILPLLPPPMRKQFRDFRTAHWMSALRLGDLLGREEPETPELEAKRSEGRRKALTCGYTVLELLEALTRDEDACLVAYRNGLGEPALDLTVRSAVAFELIPRSQAVLLALAEWRERYEMQRIA